MEQMKETKRTDVMKETKKMEVMKDTEVKKETEKVEVMMELEFGSGSALGSSFSLDSKAHVLSSSFSFLPYLKQKGFGQREIR